MMTPKTGKKQDQRNSALFIFLMALVLSTKTFAQDVDTSHKSTSSSFIIRDLSSMKNVKTLYILNDKKYYTNSSNKIAKIIPEPSKILSLKILREKAETNEYGSKGNNGVIIIVTKTFAINQYQIKFSNFSKEFKSYLKTHQYYDRDFLYVVNGVPTNEKLNEGIKKLDDISTKDIKQVIFKNKGSILDNIQPIVVITTKQ